MGNKMNELISIIVPIYNVELCIKECIESIIHQTYRNLEIILVDDGSTDGCHGICDEYAAMDNRIVVVHKQNEGLVRARKSGLNKATADIICYVDGDDWIEPDMLEKMYTRMKDNQADVVICGRYEENGSNSKRTNHNFKSGLYDKPQLKSIIYPKMIEGGSFFTWGIMPNVWDKLYRRSLLEPFQMMVDDEIVMGEDAACVYPCLLNANSIYIMDECFYHYRQSGNSMIKADARRNDGELIRRLYFSVNDYFMELHNPYNICEQWLDYILFLMIPRMENTYKGLEDLPFLFPFPNVKKGDHIIIYGMGTYGHLLSKYVLKSGFCELVAVADQNYQALNQQGLSVIAPEKINTLQYDAIVIASSFAATRDSIYNSLGTFYPKEKIHVMDEELIRSKETLEAFGLYRK